MSTDSGTSFLDWLTVPALGLSGAPLALGFLLIALLAIVASLWWTGLPGPVTRAERRSTKKSGWITTVLGLGSPFVLWMALGYLYFPLEEPVSLALSSRARVSLPADSVNGDKWLRNWSESFKEPVAGEVLDSGPLVDTVLHSLLTTPPVEGWDRNATQVVERVREDTVRAVREQCNALPQSPAIPVSHRVETELPAWLVESVELAVLKGVTQCRNVRQILAMVQPRDTSLGPTWGESVKNYLQADASRVEQPIAPYIVPADDPPAVFLRAVISQTTAEGELTTALLFEVNVEKVGQISDANWHEAATVRLLKADGSIQGEVDLSGGLSEPPLSKEVGFQGVSAKFGRVNLGADIQIQHPYSGQTLPLLGEVESHAVRREVDSEADVEVRSVTIVTDSNRAEWGATLTALFHEPAFTSFRQRIGISSGDRVVPSFPENVPNSGAVVQVVDEGVWIYDGKFVEKVRDTPLRPFHLVKPGTYTARNIGASAGPPGISSWEGTQLGKFEGYSIVETERPSYRAFAYPLVEKIIYGAGAKSGQFPTPLVTVLPVKANGEEGLATFIGLNPRALGVLLDVNGQPGSQFDSALFEAFWSTTISALRLVSSTHVDSNVSRLTGGGRIAFTRVPPMVLLGSRELRLIRSDALMLPYVLVGIGLIGYCAWIVVLVARAR